MNEAIRLIQKLERQHRVYLETYFAGAPFWLMDAFQVVHMPKNRTFITEGEPAEDIYILLKGTVVAEEHRVKDMTYGFIRFFPIEVFGVMELMLEMEEYRTTLVTTTESVFLFFFRKLFGKWFEHDFCAYRMECKKVGRYLLEQARKERLYVLLQGVERIYLVLYKMYQSYAGNGKCSLYMSRKDFTETAGVSERTVTRTLKSLEEKGCITRDGWKIRIDEQQYGMIRELLEDKMYEFEE